MRQPLSGPPAHVSLLQATPPTTVPGARPGSTRPLLISLGCCLPPPQTQARPLGLLVGKTSMVKSVTQSRWEFGSSTKRARLHARHPHQAVPKILSSFFRTCEISVPAHLSSRSKCSPALLGPLPCLTL